MADIKKIATRESYGNALVELGREHADVVVLDADLAGATKTSTFKKEFPDRIPLTELYNRYHLTKELIVQDVENIFEKAAI